MGINDTYFLTPAHLEIARARYFRKNDNGMPVEGDMESVFWREVGHVFQNDLDDPHHVSEAIRLRLEKKIVPAGRPLAQAGTDVKNLFNCFVLPIGDTREEISRLKTRHFHIQAFGGGTGINFSRLRPRGAVCKKTQGHASGAVGFITDVSYQSANIAQGGNRSGANLGVLECWHPDLLDFITYKSHHNWENIRRFAEVFDEDAFAYFQWNVNYPWQTFNVSVWLDDEFVGRLKKNDPSPYTFEWEGEPWHVWEFTNPIGPRSRDKYDVKILVTAPNEEIARYKASTKVPYFNASDMEMVKGPFDYSVPEIFDMLARNAWEDGCPGVIFGDLARRHHNGEYFAPLSACNPCAEQFLPDNSVCCLTSLCLPSFFTHGKFDRDEFRGAIISAVRSLDNMIELNEVGDEDIDRMTKVERRIGLGTTAVAELLIMEGLRYDSEAARHYVEDLMIFLRDEAYDASIELAIERGPFPAFDFEGYSKSLFFKKLPERLRERIKVHGIRNVTVLTQAPVGTTGTTAGYAQGCEPYFAMAFQRNSRVGTFLDGSPAFRHWLEDNKINYEIHGYNLSKLRKYYHVPEHFVEAHEIHWRDHLKMQAIFAEHVDSGVTKTINLPNGATVEDVKQAFLESYDMGIKSTTVYRDGSKEQILERLDSESREKKPTAIVRTHAPKRPRSLPCEVHHVTVKGERWTVVVGIYGGHPYELFAGPSSELSIPDKCKSGFILKEKKGQYSFAGPGGVDVRDISRRLFSDEHKAITRLISTSLRHGVPSDFLVDQLKKAEGTLVDFSTAVARVLKKYYDSKIDKYVYICEGCGSVNVNFNSGCPSCTDCGWSKCG